MKIFSNKRIDIFGLIFCLIFLPVNIYSQKAQKPVILLPVKVKGRWGYINDQGRIVIKPRFYVAGKYSEGFAPVRDDDGWFYYIDQTGREITKGARYRFADDFSEGLAAVQGEKAGDKLGFIDQTGKLVIRPQFDGSTGKITGKFKDGLAFVAIKGKIGFIDRTGKFVIAPQFDTDITLNATPFSEGSAVIRRNGQYGYIDHAGQIIIPAQFQIARNFQEGLAGVSFDRLKFGFIDQTGKMLIEPHFDWAGSFSEGLAAVNVGMAWHGHQKSGGEWGFIDHTGKTVIEIEYESAGSFSDGLALVRLKGKCGFIDRTGKMRIEPQFDWAEEFENGFSRVTVGEKIGYIDRTGKYIWKSTQQQRE